MIEIFKRVKWFFIAEKKKYILLIISLIIISSLQTLPPVLVGKLIDEISLDTLELNKLLIFGGGLLLIPIIVYILNRIFHVNMNIQGQKLSMQLRVKYLNKMFDADSKLFEQFTKGELISRLTNDMLAITQAFTVIISDTVYCFSLIFFVLFTMIFTISFKLTLVAFTIIPLTFFVLTILRQRMRKYYKIHRKIYDKFYENTLESIEGQRVVRAYTQEDNDFKKNEQGILNDIKSWIKIIKFEVMFGPMFDFTIAVATFLTFSYGTFLVINSEITPGQLVTFSIYIVTVSGPIQVLANVYNLLNQAQIGSERYFEVLDYENELVEDEKAQNIIDFEEIRFNNVSFKYPFDKRNVINNITFTIKKGETVGIVGKSGSGKSTLIRQLLREFNISEGTITIDKKDISEYKIDAIRSLVGYVPQVHTLFKGSVVENLVIGNHNAQEDMKNYAINVAAFNKDLNYMNDGINTYIGESGNGLSGGQKQRLSIARAIVKDPQILILDDSLSAVDANTEKTIIKNIEENRSDKTNIIISHRFSAVKGADKILVLSEGQIKERGTHEELMQQKGWYYTHYLEQIKGSDIDANI